MLINISNLKKTYQLGETQVEALKGLSLQLAAGEFTALIGASGSGKSTLLNLIGCLDDADSGEIVIDGVSLGSLNENQKSEFRNLKIGYIFQTFNLVPVLSVFENIELPLVLRTDVSPDERRRRVQKAIDDVELTAFQNHRPDHLSGGQRQRVAIARALVTEPQLILADEPTANLDSKTAHKIIDLLIALNEKRKMTFLFCSHDEKLIGRVGRVIRISDGVIVES